MGLVGNNGWDHWPVYFLHHTHTHTLKKLIYIFIHMENKTSRMRTYILRFLSSTYRVDAIHTKRRHMSHVSVKIIQRLWMGCGNVFSICILSGLFWDEHAILRRVLVLSEINSRERCAVHVKKKKNCAIPYTSKIIWFLTVELGLFMREGAARVEHLCGNDDATMQ